MLRHVSNLAVGQLQGDRQFPKDGNPSNEAAADLRLRLHATNFTSVIRAYLIHDVWVKRCKLLAVLLNKPYTNVNKYSYLCFSSSVLKHKDVIYCYFGNSYFLIIN
jgi:hypothetical protein